MGTSSLALRDRLLHVAGQQGGYFTAKQAIAVGYQDAVHGYHVRKGHWERVGWGIYRLAHFPETRWSELHKVLLWSRNKDSVPQGVFCGLAAIAIRQGNDSILDFNSITLCVPRKFRRSADSPDNVRLIFKDLCKTDIEICLGFPIVKSDSDPALEYDNMNPKVFPKDYNRSIEIGED